MTRLIDADVLIENIIKSIPDLRKFSTKTVGEVIDNTPTVDAVPVIRCKDCKYSKCIEPNDDWLECQHDKRVNHSDGYCNWAERKEE